MKIKIVKCSKDSFWYNSYVGEVFEVTDKLSKDDEWYGVWRDKQREAGGFVMKSDAVEINGQLVTDEVIEKIADKYMKEWHYGSREVFNRATYIQGLRDMKEYIIKQHIL